MNSWSLRSERPLSSRSYPLYTYADRRTPHFSTYFKLKCFLPFGSERCTLLYKQRAKNETLRLNVLKAEGESNLTPARHVIEETTGTWNGEPVTIYMISPQWVIIS